ncbi:DNA polymerase-3 subunit gamma/tau [Chromobacterium alkanivorans]|uniref:DNA polymerase III subunit gamma/tau n=1 Tax=Chromobacterium alkanivorans TaxID=1071719 RepID=UPI002168A4DB|nr:DNA polymerase III subunit gamma/tau [Chromobacterium alkanivorans]MCS3804285.1 DNA polymerase-3 subunit gamma/tau [Chromobacterium alkanivorans]MCS3818495.1 DNA polymerase-3 subunit gamma/tau [Chromobacterium alkanivorans]MCS3873570.1 DNA polymerase-3 subunit gamma/tau [Chromobacterium alkanivorans]
MSYQVLARKWRPKRFADLVGQEHVVRALTNALKEQRLHHAYLLTGTRGVGKTTIARILAKSLNCETGTTAEPCGECSACRQIDTGRFVDLLEIDAASNTGIDNIREVLENAQYAPTSGRFKVYIIDEVHMLSKSAFNAMLKTLEEPPAHVKFILATTDPQKVPVTVLSRCLQFSLRNMTPQQVAGHLAHMLDVEGIAYEAPALALLGRAASGSMRDAQSLLDQAIAYGLGEVKEDGVRAMLGAVDRRYLFALLQALAAGDGPQLMAEADGLAERGVSFEGALSELAVLLQQLALLQTVPQAVAQDEPERDALQALADAIAPQDVQLYYQIAIHGRKDLALAPDEHAGFNMTLLRMLAFHPANARAEAAPARPAAGAPTRPQPPQAQPAPAASGGVSPAARALQAAGLSSPAARQPAPPPAQDSAPAAEPEPEPAAPAPAPAAARPPEPVRQAAPPPEPEPEEEDAADDGDVSPDDVPWDQGAAADEEMPSYLQAPPEEPADYRFDGDWQALVTELGVKLGAARMLAHNAVLKDWDQDRLALAVPESFRHMTSRDYQDKLKLALRERFGRPVELAVTVEELGLETPAMKDARHRQEQLDIARENMKNDPVVQQMVREFDATLLIETIQPVKE